MKTYVTMGVIVIALTAAGCVSKEKYVAATAEADTIKADLEKARAQKNALEQQVKTYADTFEKWVEAYDRVRPLRSIIDIDNQNMLPRADEIIRHARLRDFPRQRPIRRHLVLECVSRDLRAVNPLVEEPIHLAVTAHIHLFRHVLLDD